MELSYSSITGTEPPLEIQSAPQMLICLDITARMLGIGYEKNKFLDFLSFVACR